MPTIYYGISGPPKAGGQYVNHQHVQALREAGFNAKLFYWPQTNVAEKIDTQLPVQGFTKNFVFDREDVIVVPEAWRKPIHTFSQMQVRKILHCQNPYYLFQSVESIRQFEEIGYEQSITCSHYTGRYMRAMGYGGEIHIVRPPLGKEFLNQESISKKLQIAFMPRKRAIESVHVKGLFKSIYPQYAQVPWISIQNVSRRECASFMRESAVFASFSDLEGLGLPPLEAMASGCIIVGFDGGGGEEYRSASNGLWVREGDHFGYARALAQAIQITQSKKDHFEIVNAGFETVKQYTSENFNIRIIKIWKEILGDQISKYMG
jgi:hypothetical protein